MECVRCGAFIEPTVTACPYCRAPTPSAERAHEEERERKERELEELASAEARDHAAAREKLEQYASRAFVLSLVGTVICFIPILQIVSIVSYLRARTIARRLGLDVPWKATSGFLLSSFWIVTVPAFIVWAIISDNESQARADVRITALDAEVQAGALQPTLDWKTACALAELHALKNGHAGEKGKNLTHFDCSGKIAGSATRPTLEPFSFTNQINDKKFEVAACFERGAKWFVKELNAGRVCPP